MRTAAYARYSSDNQRDASLDDQLRNCRTYCERQGWPEPVVYTDAAISGARLDRPGYRTLLDEAQRYDVILVDDLSRLSRDSIECASTVKRLRFAGVRLIGVSDGVDTARKSHKADVGLRGLMSELYLDDLAEKTHRGQTGRALAGACAGGLPYGYRVTSVGERAIDDAQAEVVRRIYAERIAGRGAREIAARLNRDGVPSARGTTWCASAIHGDLRRGIGILANPIYCGRLVWNRSHWVKHPDSGRRVRQERPQAEWVIAEKPELAIVDAATWEAAQDRIRGSHRDTAPNRHKSGRPPKHLLSGILRCAECGGPMVIVDRYRYGCATHKERGAPVCGNRLRVPRTDVEHSLLTGVRESLLTKAAFQRFQRAATDALKRTAPDIDAAKARVRAAERAHGNIMAAIRAGIITPSTRAELIAAERDLDDARARLIALQAYQPAQILPRAREVWRRCAATLSERVRDIPAARDAIRSLIGERVTLRNENGAIYAEIAPYECQINVVAGACSVRYLTEPIRIPITKTSTES